MQNLSPAVKKTMLTLTDIENMDKGPIYVLNSTKRPEQGEVSFTVPKLSGSGVDNVIIPSTFIPIDLMEQVSRKQLMESSEFKRAVRGKVLTLISKDYAEELLSEEDATHEQDRIFNLSQATMNMAQSLDTMQTGDMIHPELARRATVTNTDNDVVDGVLPKVAAVMTALQEDDDERGAISSLRMVVSQLTDKDFSYIIKQCGNKYNLLKDWSSKRLNG